MALSKLTYNSLNVTAAAGSAVSFDSGADDLSTIGGGSIIFIKKLTASSSATVSFVDGTSDVVLDDTYKEYLFTFNNIHGETDNQDFQFQGNAAGGSGYDETITSTFFIGQHDEADTYTSLEYQAARDLAEGTGFQSLSTAINSGDADSGFSGYLRLFNPSSTTYTKHFTARGNNAANSDYSVNCFVAGYFNTTSAIDEIQFKIASGDIDSGDICLYGIN